MPFAMPSATSRATVGVASMASTTSHCSASACGLSATCVRSTVTPGHSARQGTGTKLRASEEVHLCSLLLQGLALVGRAVPNRHIIPCFQQVPGLHLPAHLSGTAATSRRALALACNPAGMCSPWPGPLSLCRRSPLLSSLFQLCLPCWLLLGCFVYERLCAFLSCGAMTTDYVMHGLLAVVCVWNRHDSAARLR